MRPYHWFLIAAAVNFAVAGLAMFAGEPGIAQFSAGLGGGSLVLAAILRRS